MSQWQRQEGHLDKIVPVPVKYLGRPVRALEQGVDDFKFTRTCFAAHRVLSVVKLCCLLESYWAEVFLTVFIDMPVSGISHLASIKFLSYFYSIY